MFIYPYVYRLDHPITGEFYIGFRSANKVPAEKDLGHKYFTSSKFVKPRFHEFSYQVIAEFFDVESAYEFEQKLIQESWNNPLILNKHCFYTKEKFSRAGVKLTDETKQKQSKAKLGKPRSDKAKQKISAGHKGLTHSDETKQKISETLKKNCVRPTNKCCRIHDRKEMFVANFMQWLYRLN